MTLQLSTAPQERPLAASQAKPVDVLILTALQDELEAVLALAEGWAQGEDRQGLRFNLKSFESTRGEELRIAAAWTGEMGPVAAAGRAQQLVNELDPGCLAMCGICAGCRDKVTLGDVIIADRLYRYDTGKVSSSKGRLYDLRTFDLTATWKMEASFLTRELDTAALAKERPVSRAAQQRWLWDVATGRGLAVILPCAEGWAAFTPDGRYKLGGDIGGAFWHVIGLCRFEPGELDPYIPGLRVPDGAPLLP